MEQQKQERSVGDATVVAFKKQEEMTREQNASRYFWTG